jgi:DNA (cytosine-5)-methyltransferase 1
MYKILRSQYYNAPQKRERLIGFVVRKDLTILFVFPKENDSIVFLGKIIKDCPKSTGQKYSEN